MEVNFKELTFKGERPLVFILSGAGLSAESGIPTFRDANGLWRKYDPKELASIGALERHTQDVFDFYNERIKNAEPLSGSYTNLYIASQFALR
ncbi:Sir2 family NAD-dependent protein deacetylase [Parasutterella sp.]|uniref:Sir2 family NAD-dependent protein deacetylase n=1 Tax=Parasutterella sp. TaxID=2049037 RepID=UPI003521D1DA